MKKPSRWVINDDGTLTALPLLPPLLLRFATVVVVQVAVVLVVLVVSGVPGLAWSVAASVAPLKWPSVYKEV